MVTTTKRGDDRPTIVEGMVHIDGTGGLSLAFPTPDETLRTQCGLMLQDQTTEDARRANREERMQAGWRVLAWFLVELPNSDSRLPGEETARLGGRCT